MNPFVQRHQEKIVGVLTCFDRVVTMVRCRRSATLAGYLTGRHIRLFDYPR